MCKICGHLFCPPACPSYRGISPQRGRPIGMCIICSDYIYKEDFYYTEKGHLLCADCAEACE